MKLIEQPFRTFSRKLPTKFLIIKWTCFLANLVRWVYRLIKHQIECWNCKMDTSCWLGEGPRALATPKHPLRYYGGIIKKLRLESYLCQDWKKLFVKQARTASPISAFIAHDEGGHRFVGRSRLQLIVRAVPLATFTALDRVRFGALDSGQLSGIDALPYEGLSLLLNLFKKYIVRTIFKKPINQSYDLEQ